MGDRVALSRREREVLDLLVRGLTNLEIADRLTLSHWTVKRHIARVLARTHLRGRVDLALWYVDQGRPDRPSESGYDPGPPGGE